MAAYSAVVCFEQLVGQLLSTDHFPKEDILVLQNKVKSLKNSIERIFPAPRRERDDANRLGEEIRYAVYRAQDKIEFFLLGQGLVPSESAASFSLQELISNMDYMMIDAERLAHAISDNKYYEQDDDDYLRIDPDYETREFDMKDKKIVGQDKDKWQVHKKLLCCTGSRLVISITGMAGIGKTTLARSIYQDSLIRKEFPYHAWVTVKQDYSVRNILRKLLVSVESRGYRSGENVHDFDEAKLRVMLHQTLSNNKYLVVIDDIWDIEVWDRICRSLPDNENGSRVVVTTRIRGVAESVASSSFIHEMKPLDKRDSWELLSLMTFQGAMCPPHLEKLGKQIAKKCQGLPLKLSVVGGILAYSKRIEYWQSTAEDISGAIRYTRVVEVEAYKEIMSLSYNYLPPQLKGCFLYMAAFPADTEILVSKLVKLWVAEGILTPPSPPQTIERVAEESLLQLIDRYLVVGHKKCSDGRIKTCGINESLRDVALEEAERENFLYSVKEQFEQLKEGPESQRRVSVHKTALICRRQVYQSTKLISLARSLLYVDPSYPHPLPFCLTFDLLRVLDAFTVFFIEFPHEIIKLIHLRYLSFTFNDKLPSSLSNLTNLQVLMVRRQFKIIFVGVSFLPEEIWNMSQLRHLMFTESDIPRPCGAENSSALLANLQSLSNVSVASFTKEVLQNMPNLKKLGLWMQEPGVVNFHVDQLCQLESFKFTVLSPDHGSMVHFHPKLSFPETLRKLSLSGCGLPWEDMKIIEKLPNLEVLKLRELAFHGDEWCPTNVFKKLKHLLIEYLNLKWLGTDGSHFPRLERLIFRHCYELEEISQEIGYQYVLELLELVDCSPGAVQCAEHIEAEAEYFDNRLLQVHIKSL